MKDKTGRRVFLGAFLGALAGVVLSGLMFIAFAFILYQTQVSPCFEQDDFGEFPSESLEPPDFSVSQPHADYDWKIIDLDGNEVDFVTFKGELIFLNIWATWCPPCVAEMPTIQALHNRMGGKIRMACVSGEELQTVKAFAEKKQYSFPIFVLKGNLPEVYETDGIPATFIIDEDGQLAFSEVGGANWGHESVVEYLNNLLNRRNVAREND